MGKHGYQSLLPRLANRFAYVNVGDVSPFGSRLSRMLKRLTVVYFSQFREQLLASRFEMFEILAVRRAPGRRQSMANGLRDAIARNFSSSYY